jgi:hypothetical protein
MLNSKYECVSGTLVQGWNLVTKLINIQFFREKNSISLSETLPSAQKGFADDLFHYTLIPQNVYCCDGIKDNTL